MSTKFSLNTFRGLTIKYGGAPGAHNEEEEGRRWSAKRPHGKLKFPYGSRFTKFSILAGR